MPLPSLRIVRPRDPDRAERLLRLLRRAESTPPEVEASARRILDDVRSRGDVAVREHTERFEGRKLGALEIDRATWEAEAKRVSPEMAKILAESHRRIARFYKREAEIVLGGSFSLEERGAKDGLPDSGVIDLRFDVRPLARAGIYAPGGTARYPSTVLMTAAPARAAGVGELILVTPGPSPETLHAALLCGVDRVFAIGGAQAIGALAYGTESVPRVDKIVGPGNAYVAAAKRLVFGDVDIDQVAGPSEVLILADESADAEVVAADLLAQAEHDADAYPVLATPSEAFARAVADAVETQLATLPREKIARRSIEGHGAAVVFSTLAELVTFANRFAPEHLEVQLLELAMTPRHELAARFPNAGAIFCGAAPEAIGDYNAGPSHVLPTGGSARFSSPLGVHDFIKRTSVIYYSDEALLSHADDVAAFARAEGLDGHARSVEIRAQAIRRRGSPS